MEGVVKSVIGVAGEACREVLNGAVGESHDPRSEKWKGVTMSPDGEQLPACLWPPHNEC